MLGALAGQRFEARITGDGSLRRRPMRRVTIPLREMGVRVAEERGDGLPLRVRGGVLHGVTYRSPVASAQVKSAILLAGLGGGVPVTVVEPARSRDHTERMLQFLGFPVATAGAAVSLDGSMRTGRLGPFTLEVPGDLSSAAFLVGAALLSDGGELRIENVGINPTRAGFLDVVARMGGTIEQHDRRVVCGEPVADLVVRPSTLSATEVRSDEIPGLIDEVPVLAVLATRASGETVFRSVGELRVKESDRLGLIASNLRSIGVVAEVHGEDLSVVGTDQPLRGSVETARDHRLVMAFAVLGSQSGAAIELSETASADVSYPGFFRDLHQIGGGSWTVK